MFLHDDGIGTGRYGCACENACAGPRFEFRANGAGRDSLGDRHGFARFDFTGAHGVAVHCAVIERRHVQGRCDLHGKHASQSVSKGHALCLRDRARMLKQEPDRLVIDNKRRFGCHTAVGHDYSRKRGMSSTRLQGR